jgi:site-specific DNA-methyltransferase (adenine-specific)
MGKKIQKEEKAHYGALFGAGKSIDTSALFFLACLKITKDGGNLGLLLPESFFNIANFEDVRRVAADRELGRIIDYGKAFKGLITKAIGVTLRNSKRRKESPSIVCKAGHEIHTRKTLSFIDNPKTIFNFWCTSDEADVVRQAYLLPHFTLAGHCDWALGIVTGDNDRFCSTVMKEGHIPVLRGADIYKNNTLDQKLFIPNDFSLYQQVAPREFYEAKEKIIYKFISEKLCFYHDTEQKYVLNSANILIPRKSLKISPKQLCDLLNSEFINWVFSRLFLTHKILRSDLEQLPIHTQYFTKNQTFSEESYLDFLSIERATNGTYRIKRQNY